RVGAGDHAQVCAPSARSAQSLVLKARTCGYFAQEMTPGQDGLKRTTLIAEAAAAARLRPNRAQKRAEAACCAWVPGQRRSCCRPARIPELCIFRDIP